MSYIGEDDIQRVEVTARVVEKFLDYVRRKADSKIDGVFSESGVSEQFLWGSKYHKADNLDYQGYGLHLRGVIFSFLVDNYYSEDVSVDLDDFFDELDSHSSGIVNRSLGLNIDRVFDTPEGGMYDMSEDSIWMKFVPEEEIPELESLLEDNLGGEGIDDVLLEFPEYYNSINHLDEGDRTWRRFLSTLEHERTHRFIAKKSRIKGDLVKALQEGKDPEQLKAVTATTELKMIDEVFGHFVGWKIDRSNTPVPGGYDGGDEYLIWGIEYLGKYYKARCSSLEDIRKLESRIFSRIVEKGQLDQNGDRINPFIYFIEQSLSDREQERIEKLHRINSSELSQIIPEIKQMLSDADTGNRLKKDLEELEEINTISTRLLNYLLEKSKEKELGPQEVEEYTDRFLKQEKEDIKEIMESIDGYNPSSKHVEKEIGTLEKHCKKLLRDLKKA